MIIMLGITLPSAVRAAAVNTPRIITIQSTTLDRTSSGSVLSANAIIQNDPGLVRTGGCIHHYNPKHCGGKRHHRR